MLLIDTAILIAGILILLSIASSKFSARVGMPVLVMFLGLGMLAGSEGIGGIAFEDYSLAYAIGTVALVLILFSGGLSTPFRSVLAAWRPAGVLATVGVFITALITGLASSWILQLSLLQGLLLGSIVGSTDAAAVFSVLRTGGVHIRRRLADTLEVESGSNDPMAIFLTIGLIEVITGRLPLGPGLLLLFLNQMVVGVVVGAAIGHAAVWVINRIHLGVAGLYPILATAFGLFAFGLAADLGGSGFLAVYLAGMIIGNRRLAFHRGIVMFHDAAAWFGQIAMFIVLGLLSFPSRLLDVWGPGLAIAAVLVLLARPLAIALSLFPFRFSIHERTFLSWVGLKGAVPITLATFPLLAGIPSASLIFDVVFFVVLVSAIVQGWSLPWVARKLKVDAVPKRSPPVTLEISSFHDVDGDVVDFYIDHDTRAAGRQVQELALPEDVVIALIVRERHVILPKGNTRLAPGDHVVIVLKPAVRTIVDRIFSRQLHRSTSSALPATLEFPLRGTIKVGELEQFYDIDIGGLHSQTLDEWIRRRVGEKKVAVGSSVSCDRICLRIREMDKDGRVSYVGMSILPMADPASSTEKNPGTSTSKQADTGGEAFLAASNQRDPNRSEGPQNLDERPDRSDEANGHPPSPPPSTIPSDSNS